MIPTDSITYVEYIRCYKLNILYWYSMVGGLMSSEASASDIYLQISRIYTSSTASSAESVMRRFTAFLVTSN